MSDLVKLRRPAGAAAAPLSDDAIARACGGRDAEAIGELFDRFHRPVARYVWRLLGGGADVEDVVQSTFLEVSRGNTVYDGRASVLTWLLAIATNVVRHHRRSLARRLRLAHAVASELTGSRPPAAEGQSAAREQLARAQAVLDGMSHELREAFVLCDLEGLSARDAGAVLGLSEAAVWQRASRARRALRAGAGGGE